MLEIPEIYLNFATDPWKIFASRWVLETSKALWEILTVSLHPKHDDVYVSWVPKTLKILLGAKQIRFIFCKSWKAR